MLLRNEFIAGEINRAASVNFHLAFAKKWLEDDTITEICVNRPFEVMCERQNIWETHNVPTLTLEHLKSLATATAKFSSDDVSDNKPILSAILPNGERIQVVLPPACEHGTLSVTIRKPSFSIRTLDSYEKQGFFQHVKPAKRELSVAEKSLLSDDEIDLRQLRVGGLYVQFLRKAVQLEKVIIVVGETGSGKTTFMKALMQEISTYLRIITIEDVPELFLPNHPNHVHLYYPSEADEENNASVTAASLLKSCLRMKPDRILLAELRGGETFDFINIAASGHGGSITSCHAGSCELAFERLALMVLRNRQGRTLPYAVIRRLLYLVVDVVIHVKNDTATGKGRHVTDIWYNPLKKHNPDSTE